VFNAYVAREKAYLLSEMVPVKGLMPLLMKPRNGERWTAEDKVLLRQHLRRIARLSPYLFVLLMPGGFFIMPLLSWWLDRRRNRARRPPT
jgi:hypothetical protein